MSKNQLKCGSMVKAWCMIKEVGGFNSLMWHVPIFLKYKILKTLEKQVSLIVCLVKSFWVFLVINLEIVSNESNPSIILPKKIFVFLIN
jgi:hypothetical protein